MVNVVDIYHTSAFVCGGGHVKYIFVQGFYFDIVAPPPFGPWGHGVVALGGGGEGCSVSFCASGDWALPS